MKTFLHIDFLFKFGSMTDTEESAPEVVFPKKKKKRMRRLAPNKVVPSIVPPLQLNGKGMSVSARHTKRSGAKSSRVTSSEKKKGDCRASKTFRPSENGRPSQQPNTTFEENDSKRGSSGAMAASSSDTSLSTYSTARSTLVSPVRYEYMEIIERGSETIVYRCFDRLNSQFVAIKEQKITSSQHATPRGFHECTIVQFINEEKNLSRDVGSRFVIGFVDQYTNPRRDSYYLVTPYYVIGDLLTFSNTERDSGHYPKTIKDLMRDVLFGLRYLHKIGVAHRDIKPDNIFIHYDSGLGRESARIADFGLATIVNEHGDVTGAENPGTIFYAAPEVFIGNSTRDPRPSDVWSFASTLFSVVYGWYPFVDEKMRVAKKMDKNEFDNLWKHIFDRTCYFDSNHLRMTRPAEFSDKILEVFSMCFVPRKDRPSADEVLDCEWFRSMPDCSSFLLTSFAKSNESVDLENLFCLNGFDPARDANHSLVLSNPTKAIHTSTQTTKLHARFRFPDRVRAFALRKKKE